MWIELFTKNCPTCRLHQEKLTCRRRRCIDKNLEVMLELEEKPHDLNPQAATTLNISQTSIRKILKMHPYKLTLIVKIVISSILVRSIFPKRWTGIRGS